MSPLSTRAEAQNDRLVAAAVKFAHDIAKQHDEAAGVSSGGGGSGGSGSSPEWVLCAGQLPEYTFKSAADEAGEDGKRPFAVALEWIDDVFTPAARLKFPTVVGLPHGLEFALPTEASIVGRALSVTARIDPAAVQKKKSFKVTHLMIKRVEAAASGDGGDGGDGGGHGGGGEGGEGGESEGSRPPIPSQVLPPVPIVVARARLVTQARYTIAAAARDGDCYLTSGLASAGDITPHEALHPTEAVGGQVQTLRTAAIDCVAGDGPIGGIDASVYRTAEHLPADAAAAEAAMLPWRTPGHWRTEGEEFKSPIFMFGAAVAGFGRPVIVLEERDGAYLNPASCYGALDANGALHRTAARGGAPETIESFYPIPFDQVVAAMQRAEPPLLISFDGVDHHSPFVRVEVAPTEIANDEDVHALDGSLSEGSIESAAEAAGAAAEGVDAAAHDPDETLPPDGVDGDDGLEEQPSPVLEIALPAAEQAVAAAPDEAAAEPAVAEAVEAPQADTLAAEATVAVAAPAKRRRDPEEAARAKAARQEAAAEKAAQRAEAKAEREAAMVAKKAAREAAMSAKKAEREAAAAANKAEREAVAAARAAAKPAKAPKAPVRPKAKAALASALRTLLAHVDDEDSDIPALAASLLSRGKHMAKASTSGISKRAPRPSRPPPPPPPVLPPPPPSSRGRAIKRKAHYGDAGELDGSASSFRSAPVATTKPIVSLAEENGVPQFAMPGNRVWARGWHGGAHKWFKARVVALRVRFPRIHVAFEEDEHGSAHKLALPELDAYVCAADVRELTD